LPPPPPPGAHASVAAPPAQPNTAAMPPPPPPVAVTPPPPPAVVVTGAPPPPAGSDSGAMAALLIRAMISAAKADGIIDDAERRRILDRLVDTSPEERAFVEAELQKPLDPDEWLTDVPSDPTLTGQIYTASLLAIELDTSAEVKYLKALAYRLNLAENAVNRIHDQLGVIRIFA